MTPPSERQAAEKFALSAALRYPDLAEEAGLTARDFGHEGFCLAWDAIARVEFRDESGRLPLAHLSAESGVSVEHLAEACRCQVYAPDQARHWWARLRDLSAADRLEHELATLLRKKRQGDDHTGELLAELEQLHRHYSSQEVEREATEQADVAAAYVAERSAELRCGRRIGLVTGMTTIDDWVGGLNPGELTTLVAAGGSGKSTLAFDLARRVAAGGASVLIFSAEMTARQVGQREIHAELGRPIADRSVGAVDMQDALQRITDSTYARRIVTDFRTRLTSRQVLATARRVQSQRGLGLLVFDHFGHWDSERPRATEVEQLSVGIQQVKDCAKLLDVPFLLLTHFSRARRDADWPSIEMIRGTGKIDDVSDNIIALWRPTGERTSLHMLKIRQNGQATNRAMELVYEMVGQRFGEVGEIYRNPPPLARQSARGTGFPSSQKAPF